MDEIVVIIVGMALATYFSRVTPFLFKFKSGEKFIKYIPISVFAALVFPEIVGFDIKTIAGVLTFIAAYFSRNMFLTMVVGILALYILSNI
jgi:branched-subunit amino acid transport protein